MGKDLEAKLLNESHQELRWHEASSLSEAAKGFAARRMSKVSIVDQVGKSDDVHPRFNPEEAQHVHDAELKGGGSQQRSPKKRFRFLYTNYLC